MMPQTSTAPVAIDHQRRGLLAKVHVAKAQMGLTDSEYEAMLTAFKVESAKEMTVPQLENLVKLMKHHGWKESKSPRRHPRAGGNPDQADALRRRCVEIANEIENGANRLPGLTLKICGVSTLAWCRDVKKLERLLAVLGKIKEREVQL